MDLWTETDSGWCTEVSSLPRNREIITLPNGAVFGCLSELLSKCTNHYDERENELTHWELVKNGVKYTIFND